MNNLKAYLKKIGRAMLTFVPLCCTLAACDNAIYDDEGDCSVKYRVNFRYDKNILRADAFAQNVNSVNLYAFDKSGTLVWQRSDHGEALRDDNYAMTLDLPAGDYRLLAWYGLRNEGEESESFSVPEAQTGRTRIEELQCALNCNAGQNTSSSKLHPLFHAMRDVTLPDTNDGTTYDYTMDLTKNTNHVRIVLQQLSGEPVDVNNFKFRIETANGLMAYDNSLTGDEKNRITYLPHSTSSGTASMGLDDYPEVGGDAGKAPQGREITSVSVGIADLYIGRLVTDRNRRATLTIESESDGATVARIPLTDYALMLKDGYGYAMSDQEFLDRQDEWNLTFFLDESRKWIGTSIIINSWRVVINKADFGEN